MSRRAYIGSLSFRSGQVVTNRRTPTKLAAEGGPTRKNAHSYQTRYHSMAKDLTIATWARPKRGDP